MTSEQRGEREKRGEEDDEKEEKEEKEKREEQGRGGGSRNMSLRRADRAADTVADRGENAQKTPSRKRKRKPTHFIRRCINMLIVWTWRL